MKKTTIKITPGTRDELSKLKIIMRQSGKRVRSVDDAIKELIAGRK